ncbi:Nucleotidyltransferase domain-containing protein [Desulfonema limicola]|uniref:Nucleotidyltransferase domain-containing protein n=1 Tax=Desulfonema limicola TaxID=45656 RepID=A0A975BDM0_9BACT|nr:nucleotidyltransferase family protein [Desulfonema limicola]QTA83358.1 Nucleotidyltransferase domain-containing protein [Desulfonema limicola]
MSRKDNILNILKQNRDKFRAVGVKSLGIFGSTARQTDNENSDIDILVEFEKGCRKFRNFNLLCDLLEQYFGKTYDLVTVDGLSPYIGKKILKGVEYVELAP